MKDAINDAIAEYRKQCGTDPDASEIMDQLCDDARHGGFDDFDYDDAKGYAVGRLKARAIILSAQAKRKAQS